MRFSKSGSGRIRVELLGLYPTLFTTMCKAVCNPAGVAGISTWREQLKEYPEQTVKDMETAGVILESLSEYPEVEIRPVSAISPRGLWLSMKHKLPIGLWAIIEGVVLDARTELEAVNTAVSKLRSERTKSLIGSRVSTPKGVMMQED